MSHFGGYDLSGTRTNLKYVTLLDLWGNMA